MAILCYSLLFGWLRVCYKENDRNYWVRGSITPPTSVNTDVLCFEQQNSISHKFDLLEAYKYTVSSKKLWATINSVKKQKHVSMATRNDRRQHCSSLRRTWPIRVCIRILLIFSWHVTILHSVQRQRSNEITHLIAMAMHFMSLKQLSYCSWQRNITT